MLPLFIVVKLQQFHWDIYQEISNQIGLKQGCCFPMMYCCVYVRHQHFQNKYFPQYLCKCTAHLQNTCCIILFSLPQYKGKCGQNSHLSCINTPQAYIQSLASLFFSSQFLNIGQWNGRSILIIADRLSIFNHKPCFKSHHTSLQDKYPFPFSSITLWRLMAAIVETYAICQCCRESRGCVLHHCRSQMTLNGKARCCKGRERSAILL